MEVSGTIEQGSAEHDGRPDIGQLVRAINQAHANPNTQVPAATAAFKESAEYRLAVTAVSAQRQEAAADAAEQRAREEDLAAARDRRIGQLVQAGVSPHDADRLIAEQEAKARA